MTETTTITIYPLRLMAQRQSAEMYVKHGMHLARNIGTVASIREEYQLPPTVRTWKQIAESLRDIEAQIAEAASYPGADGNDDPDEQHDEERDSA